MPMQDGSIPADVSRAFQDGMFALPPRPSALATSAAQTSWRVPVIMVAFSDAPFAYTPAQFERGLFDTTGSTPWGSVYDYYRWASGGRLRVVGNVVASVTLPYPRAYYAFGNWGLSTAATPNNLYGAIRDALQASQASVRWSDFDMDHDGYVDMLWVLHAGIGGESGLDRNAFWSITSRLSGGWRYGEAFVTTDLVPGSKTQYMRLDRFSTVPELSSLIPGARAEIGVFCHEFGHALGLPDLYDTSVLGGSTNVGPGNWSLMSTGAYGTNGITPENPSAPGAWPMLLLGWSQSVRPSRDTTLALGSIESGAPVIEFSFQGESIPEHFLIENRQREGFDRYLPSPGLLIYQVDETGIGQRLAANRINSGPIAGLRLVEADGDSDLILGRNRGDANDPFPGLLGRTSIDDASTPSTRANSGAPTNTALRNIQLLGSLARFDVQVQSPGWLRSEDHTTPGYQPVETYLPAPTTVVGSDGRLLRAGSEVLNGIPQIVLRTRTAAGWLPFEPVSQSPSGAYEPTLSTLPGGDVAIAWRDTRDGRSRLYYRARLRGTWTAELPLGSLPGDSYFPAMAGDGRGYLNVAWLQISTDRPQLKFLRFTYLSPFGDPLNVADSTSYPGPPSLAVGPNGHAYVTWPERSRAPQAIQFAFYRPDSGFRTPLALAEPSVLSQTSAASALDSAGVLHSVIQITGPGVDELHYQARAYTGSTWLRDTLIENQSSGILSPSLAMDSAGGLHVVFETSTAGVQQVRYKRFVAGEGWDFRSTEVTRPEEGDASQPRLAVHSPGNVDVLFTRHIGGVPHFMERRRLLDGPVLLAADPGPAVPRTALVLGPNPIRSGQSLDVHWAGTSAEPVNVDFFDIAGRRLGSLALEGAAGQRHGRLAPATTASWPGGLYFARPRIDRVAATRLIVLR